MNWKIFYNRKKEINCEICSSELIADIIESNQEIDMKLQQIFELMSYIESIAYRKGKIDILKFYRKINYEKIEIKNINRFKKYISLIKIW